MEITHVPIDQLVVPKWNPRRITDGAKMQELTASIVEKGVLQPLMVRKNGKGLEVIAGSRRLEAAKKAKLETVPVIVRDNVSDEEFERLALIENLQREDLDPVDEGKALAVLLRRDTHENVAKAVCRSVKYVKSRVLLSELPKEVIAEYRNGRVTLSAAVMLATAGGATREAMMDCFKQWQGYQGDYGSFTPERYRWHMPNLPLTMAPWKKDGEYAGQPACVTCPKRKGFEPELFPDIKAKDACLDATCWNVKLGAWIQAKADQLEKDGVEYVRITTRWHTNAKDVLDSAKYTVHKKATEHEGILRGLVVESDEPGTHLGTLRWICKNVCRKGTSGSGSDDFKWKQDELKRRYDQEQEDLAQKLAADELVVPAPFTEEDLRVILGSLINDAWYDARKKLCESITDKKGARENDVVEWAKDKNPEQLVKPILLAAVIGANKREFWPAVAHHGIDVKAIKAKAREAVKPKREKALARLKAKYGKDPAAKKAPAKKKAAKPANKKEAADTAA